MELQLQCDIMLCTQDEGAQHYNTRGARQSGVQGM